MKRFKSLRDVYGRIKRESVRRSGSAATVPTNKWSYFALMAFMDPYMKSSMNTQSNYAEDSAPNVPAPTSPSPEEVTGESSRSPPAPDKASDPPREKRMRGAESDRELYQLVQQSAAALHSLKKRQSSETVLWAQSVAFRLDSLPPFERAQARVRIEQVLLEAEFPGGRSQEIEESGGRMFLNL
ncbi:hypothetical protein SKAU_G00411050 [Synaphobranchus kaupii]|uniref:MADF domain-containing protein n=1 Tax=Synaphobranchus kaupii TaxID=118154 RepID=A0A9Q1E7T8_SYNKA|nr:hypothetical protein SKAU_G00411050 [Synaphobranchus kaupii]